MKRVLSIVLTAMLLLTNTAALTCGSSPIAEKRRDLLEHDNQRKTPLANRGPTSFFDSSIAYAPVPYFNLQSAETTAKRAKVSNEKSSVKEADCLKTFERSNFAHVDEDSIELVVGVNGTHAGKYKDLLELVAQNNGTLVNTVSIEHQVIAAVVDIPLNVASTFVEETQIRRLARYLEPNLKFQTQLEPNDPYYWQQWGPPRIEADLAWDTTVGDSSVLVAVIDTGLDYDHPDLEANYVALGYDWVNDDADPMDDNGHGTHCAGIIGAVLNNSVGITGLANVSLMAEKGLDAYGSGWEDDLANAIVHAVDQGANILSNSWRGYGDSILVHEAVQYAYDKNVLVVAAAGNEAWSNKAYPAAYDEAVAVTATDRFENPAGFTNFGDWVEVAAPGVDVYSTFWDDTYTYMSGTSMACPHVAGTAALIWSQFPNASRDWVRAQLRYTTDDLGDPGFDEYYGFGRINARASVERAPQEHDILIFSWEKPAHVEPGDQASFNVVALNFGVNDEQNVTIELLVDGSQTDSATITHLANGSSTTVSLFWSPSNEGTYNVTIHVVPVSGETATDNNTVSEAISVRHAVGLLLFDQTHFCDPIGMYSMWVGNLTDAGYLVDAHTTGVVTPDLLAEYDVFIMPQAQLDYSMDEISAIQNFVHDGGGLLVVGDDNPWIYSAVTDFAGLTWNSYYDWGGGFTTDITPHDVTQGVFSAYFGAPISELIVNSPGAALIRDPFEYNDVMLAVSEVGAGRVVGIADEQTLDDYSISYGSNFQLATNLVDWLLGVKYEHELVVRMEAPRYLEPDQTTLLNTTVYNRGLSNETNVEILLLINGTVAANATVPEFVNGTSYTLSSPWTPTIEAAYNVTAYVPPVLGENITSNNIETKLTTVRYPLINPVEGQFTHYALYYFDPLGHLTGTGYLNLTYDHYAEPYRIYITVESKDPSGYTSSDWMLVNTMNRLVESGMWAGLWYPAWIETDLALGSLVNVLSGTATVNGTAVIVVGPQAVDCWELSYTEYVYDYALLYDRACGLWVGMEYAIPYNGYMALQLVDTNISIGRKYEHDLGVTLSAPYSLQPGETKRVNATLYNLGLNNETDVEIQLLINNSQVASEKLEDLANGTSHTTSYFWTPTFEGDYNITARASTVLGENVTANNAATRIVPVQYIEVALVSDYNELVNIIAILNSIDVGYDVYNDNSIHLYTEDLDLLLNYEAVIFYTSYRSITSNEHSTLESYLSSGGNLLVTGFDCLVSDNLLADLVRSSTTGDNTGELDLYVVDEAHPIMSGPYGSFSNGYHISGLYSDCDIAEADTARNAVTVAELADGYDRIIATEGLPGTIVFWNGVGTMDWTRNYDCEAMFKNLLHWFTVAYEHELVVSLEAPSFLEPGDITALNATVHNRGLNDELNVELQLLINGSTAGKITVPYLLNGTSYTFSYLWTPLAGIYNVTVYTPPVSGENITQNNIYSKLISVRYAPRILAYVQHSDYHQEYLNTLKAIEAAYGPCHLTELWDYTELDSMLSGKDILLVPEQEYTSLYFMENVGAAWGESLAEFLEKGGTILVCDYSGASHGVLTGANLMSISDVNYRTYYTVYVVAPDDPLARNVSPSFTAPSGSISFVTTEADGVVDDGTHPLVIHKEDGCGHIILLGFDFYTSNVDTEQIMGNAVSLAAHITVSVAPSAGSPGTVVTVRGAKATENGTVAAYWDKSLAGKTKADKKGEYALELIVPLNTSVGAHKIMIVDAVTSRTALTTFKVMTITLNPLRCPVGAKVTVEGSGFSPYRQTTITFNDMLVGYCNATIHGIFTFTFNVPMSAPGEQKVKAFDADGYYAHTLLNVVEVTPLDVKVDAGAVYFRGEIAEFYIMVSLKGQTVNATHINATLYGPSGETSFYHYPENIKSVASGLYKSTYFLPDNASSGSYVLVVEATYTARFAEAIGTSFKNFLLSPTLQGWNAMLISVNGSVGTLRTDLGLVKVRLDSIDAKLVNLEGENVFINTTLGLIQTQMANIQLEVTAINGTTATIKTTVGTFNGRIVSVEGSLATIETEIGTLKADISSLKQTQQDPAISLDILLALMVILAIGTILLAVTLRGKSKSEKTL